MADALEYALGLARISIDTLFQRFWMFNLPSLDQLHGSAEGLTCIVTGPTSGIGREVAATLARRQAHVVLACRSLERGQAVREALEEEARRKGLRPPTLEVEELDVASVASIKKFAARWQRRRAPLHLLINNAGIFSMGAGRCETEDGFESHMGTNHLGGFLLTLLLLPSLRQAGQTAKDKRAARVVNVSSMMHLLSPGLDPTNPMLERKGTFSPVAAYNNSKLAQIQFTAELRRRIPDNWGVEAYAVHPGEVMTDVVRTLPPLMRTAYKILLRMMLLSPAEGARSIIEAALAANPGGERVNPRDPAKCYLNSDCRIAAPTKAALDPRQGQWTWAWSARKVDLPREFDLPAERTSGLDLPTNHED